MKDNKESLPTRMAEENDCSMSAMDRNDNTDSLMTEELPPTGSIPLPRMLGCFFALNGFTLGLEGLGLMYIINSKVEMPIAYLPTYGAIAFLPYSFKPLYGYLISQGHLPRYQLFTLLLFANGLAVLSTCLIPKGGVFLACLVAFVRGVTDSWAELCLGVTMLDLAQTYSTGTTTTTSTTTGTTNVSGYNYDQLASNFQAQAATARNLGSFLSYGITSVLFTGRQYLSKSHHELNGFDANTILIASGGLQVLGAMIASRCRREFQAPNMDGFQLIQASDNDEPDEASALREEEDQHHTLYSSTDEENNSLDEQPLCCPSGGQPWRSRIHCVQVVLLQLTILILAMKGPIIELSSHLFWNVLLVSFLCATILVGITTWLNQWTYTSHKVGIYLILKHAIPSDSMVFGSFLYSIFQSSPGELQVLSLLSSGVTTLSSWSYGKLLSKHCAGSRILVVIGLTTVLAAIASLGNILVVQYSQSIHIFWIVLVMQSVGTFFNEWEFLPDVVLASTSVTTKDKQTHGQVVEHVPSTDRQPDDTHPVASKRGGNVAVEYGTLISCINFGDELGSLLTGPFVALLGITREDDFKGLEHLILLCCLFNVLSIGLLPLLKTR